MLYPLHHDLSGTEIKNRLKCIELEFHRLRTNNPPSLHQGLFRTTCLWPTPTRTSRCTLRPGVHRPSADTPTELAQTIPAAKCGSNQESMLFDVSVNKLKSSNTSANVFCWTGRISEQINRQIKLLVPLMALLSIKRQQLCQAVNGNPVNEFKWV